MKTDIILKYFPNISTHQVEQFAMLEELYGYWNAQINVISRKDIDELYVRHVLHSLAIARVGAIENGDRVLDVGCGGGFPGIPLAILMPQVRFILCDSIGKKIKVVREVATALGLANVEAVHARAEQIDGSVDWVVSRAVARLNEFVGWTWNKTDKGILYLKGGDLDLEIAETDKKVELFDVEEWFNEEFFETKKVLLLRK